jgi:ethanolamine utilization protein EutA
VALGASRFVVVNREIIHESPILLTPYVDKTTIDTAKLNEFIQEAYRNAGVTPADIDTGAIIVTGEAAKKKNAEAIAALFAAQAGKFVCATAGHNLEAILASYGSGAVHMTYHERRDEQDRHCSRRPGHRHLCHRSRRPVGSHG